jgi:indole-3-glycerol phosphate synthase
LGVSIINVMAPVVSDPILASATGSTMSTTTAATTSSSTQLRTNNTFVDAQIACIENIQYPDYNQNVCFLAQIPVKSDNTQWNEIEDVWYLRDTHMFQGIYVSDVLYKGQVASTTFTGSNDRMEHPGSIIKAMISKSSKVWGVVTTKSGRGEGAREYLGDIMM